MRLLDGKQAPRGLPIAERLALHSRRDPETGCLLWTGYKGRTGHASTKVDGRPVNVHKLAWELANGTVPDGLVVRHSCDRGECMEPTHLSLGTQADNVADMISRQRCDRSGERCNSAKLTWADVRAMRAAWAEGSASRADLADQFGISRQQTNHILAGRYWREPSREINTKEIHIVSTMTAAALEERTGVSIHEHLERQMAIPVLSEVPQRQGDILFVPVPGSIRASKPLTAAGFPVVRGENGGNTHALHADTGTSFYDPAETTGQRLGVLTVEPGSTAVLSHPEHGFMAFGPGSYTVTRQREQADEIRLVQD